MSSGEHYWDCYPDIMPCSSIYDANKQQCIAHSCPISLNLMPSIFFSNQTSLICVLKFELVIFELAERGDTIKDLAICRPHTMLFVTYHFYNMLITSPGIGYYTALDLARRNARVIVAGRNKMKIDRAVDDIKRSSRNPEVVSRLLDVSSMKSVRSFAEEFRNSEQRLDILINNAGMASKYVWGLKSDH